MFDCNVIKSKIESKLSESIVEVTTPRNDNEHFAIKVIWKEFETMKLLERHRLVYDILKEEFQMGIHSVSLKTLTENK